MIGKILYIMLDCIYNKKKVYYNAFIFINYK